jgi:uncharacterized protein
MASRALRLLLAVAALVLAFAVAAEIAVPPLKARVTDLSGTLSAAEQGALEQKLEAFEARKGSQIAVLIVPTTDGEAIEPFSTRVFEQWKLGRKKVDDGVLLIVAKNDRKLRIEVGYGLEGALPDAIAKRIIEQDIAPQFRQGAFAAGVEAGVDRMIRVIDGEALPEPEPAAEGGDDLIGNLVFVFFFVMAVNVVLQSFLGRFGAAVATGLLAAVIGLMLASAFAASVMGVLGFVLSIVNGVKLQAGGGGNWSSGRSSGGSSSWSSGSSSGGGFSGGGGSSGGGGASGSW